MEITDDTLSRISKLLIDKDNLSLTEAARHRQSFCVALVCGPEVATSPTFQAALLTAAATAARCFPGAVQVRSAPELDAPLCFSGWPSKTLRAALCAPEIAVSVVDSTPPAARRVAFGSVKGEPTLRVTFDRWVGAVTSIGGAGRLPEREGCVLPGVLAGSFAVSELFLRFARVQLEATRRDVGLSLWRPGADWQTSDAAGPPVGHLPTEFWLLGLGHLGQAFSWCLSLLPFSNPRDVNLMLQDHDTVVPANIETGVLCHAGAVSRFKATVVAEWLEARGFLPRVVTRRFDDRLQVERGEPRLALCGFDGGGPRHLLDGAQFERVVEAGLGGRADNFESMTIHSVPHSTKSSAELWPPRATTESDARAVELAETRQVYQEHRERLCCGEVSLAGRSVGVPFVGCAAASLVLSETVRMAAGGPRHDLIELRLAQPVARSAAEVLDGYQGAATPTIRIQSVRPYRV